MSFNPEKVTFFAKTDARGQQTPFGIKAKDRTRHVYVIGKTGMGKSTLLENMAVQDIQNGEGLAFIDPHGQTAEMLLDYIPEHRVKDVLYFAPFDAEHPVAFNVMEDVGADKRHLVVSGLMSVFKKIWIDAWSARMEYILQNTLLALLEYPDSTLLGVNRMLSEKHYRKKVIDNISDPAVKSFWVDEFLNYNERYMQEAGDAIKNKVGQFTANPLIRNIIGQPKSSFDLRQIMDEKKIVIMNLSKGLVGESNANLLGSMLTTRIYLAAMSRADLSRDQLDQAPNFYFYVDEFQSFANATFADILSEARKYKLNLTIAHQYIEQMEEEVRNAVFGNVGTIISFRVGPFDAEVLETIFAPQFYAVDICNLGFAQVYLTLMIDGIGSKPFSAVTLPPIERPSISCKEMVIHSSRQQFSRPRAEVEQAIIYWHNEQHNPASKDDSKEKKSSPVRKSNPTNERNVSNDRVSKAGSQIDKSSPRRSEATGKDGLSSQTNTQNNSPKNKTESTSKKAQANLDELRNVLRSLAAKERKTNSTTIEKSSANNQTKPTTKESAENTSPSTPKKLTESKLKDALKDVLEKTVPAAESPESKPKPPVINTPVQTVAKDNVERQTPPPVSPASQDPLNPKKLERMMRVTTSDKPPIK